MSVPASTTAEIAATMIVRDAFRRAFMLTGITARRRAHKKG
jgi:hypothetical protein